MRGQRNCVMLFVGVVCVSAAVIVVALLLAFGSHREIAAWVMLGVVVLLPCVWAISRMNEAVLRHKRYYHHTETPLDQDGYPMYLQPGEQMYQQMIQQPKEDYRSRW